MKGYMKKSLFGVLALIMAIALIFPGINVSANDKQSEKYEMKVSYGIDGKYRAMKYMPVIVEMKSLENDFNGEIEVRVGSGEPGYYDAYSQSVSLKSGEDIKVTLPIMMPESTNKFTVNLVENKKSVLEQKVTVSAGRITEGKLFVGVLTDDFSSLGYLGDVKYKDSQGGQEFSLATVKLESSIIGDNHLTIDGLNTIFINNFNMGSFGEAEYATLNNWVSNGGTLIIGSGVNESKTVKAIDKSLFKVKSNGVSEKNVIIANENLKLPISDLEIENGAIKLGSLDNELMYSVEKGKGEILVTTFDLGMEPLISSKDASEIWSKILFEDIKQTINQKIYPMQYPYEVDTLIRNIPIEKVVDVKVLVIVFIVYALIVGVILYTVLKKMKKRDLIWIGVPVLSITFAIFIYMLGGGTRVNDLILNQVNIMNINQEGSAKVNGYVGVGTKYKNDVTLQKPQDIAMNYKGINNRYYGMQYEKKELNKLRVKTSFKDNNSYYEFADSNALEMKLFEVFGNEQSIPKLETSFNYDSGVLNGKVKNNLDDDIKKLILISGDNVWDLGVIKKGEELNLENVKTAKSSGLRAYGDELSQKYWELKMNGNLKDKTEELKNISRYGNTIKLISNELALSKESKLIAMTEMSIDYGIDFGSKSISKYDTTILMQGVEINFKDKDGNINYPEGYFKGVVESSGSNIHPDEYSGDIYGSGEVIYNFDIDNKLEVLSIKIGKKESQYGGKGGGMPENAEYFVYNYKNGDYEKIDLSSSTGFTLEEASNYSENNNIKVKIVVSDSGMGRIPNLSIKGRIK